MLEPGSEVVGPPQEDNPNTAIADRVNSIAGFFFIKILSLQACPYPREAFVLTNKIRVSQGKDGAIKKRVEILSSLEPNKFLQFVSI